MAKVQINTVESETNRTHTGDTNWSIVETIPAASIDAADYIVFCSAEVGGDTTSSPNFAFQLQESSTGISNSYSRVKVPNTYGTLNYGQSYHALWKESFSGLSNFNFKQKLVSVTTDTVHTLRTNMVMIKVDDTDTAEDALWSGDYEMSQTDVDVPSAVANEWNDCEEITIGNGSDDYLIMAVARQSAGSFSGTFDVELNVDGTPQESITRKRNATEANYLDSIVSFLAAPDTDTVVKIRFRSNTVVTSVTSNAIVAIRLNAFDDYAGVHDTDDVLMTSGDTNFVGATLTHDTAHTSETTEDWFFIGWSQINQETNQDRFENFLDQASTTISGNHNNNTWLSTWDDDSPYATGDHCLFATQNMSDTTDVDVTFGQQEEFDGGPTIETTNIIGFTHEKASDAEPPVDVGLSTELESAFVVDFIKEKPVGLVAEVSTAFAVLAAGLGGLVGLTVETDEAFAVTREGHLEIGLATEADSAFVVTPLHEIYANKVLGEDSAFGLTIGLATEPTQVAEVDSALALTHSKAVNVISAVEVDLSQEVFFGDVYFIGTATETNAALPIFVLSEGVVGKAIEIDFPLSVTANKGYIGILGLASETDTSFDVTVSTELIPNDLGWEDNDATWGGVELSSLDFAPVYLDGVDFKILGYDSTQPLDTFLERKAVVHEEGLAILGTSVWPDIIGPQGSAIQIKLGSHETPDGAIDWEGPYDFIIGGDDYVDFAITGRYLAIRFESSGIPSWTLQSYDIEYEIVGRH